MNIERCISILAQMVSNYEKVKIYIFLDILYLIAIVFRL